MDPRPRLLWTEGLFLTPQHLQQQDRHHAAAVAAVWRELAPFRWGIARMELREDGLSHGFVHVTALTAVTRDGVFLKAGDTGPANARIRTLAIRPGSITGPAQILMCLARESVNIRPVATEAELASSDLVMARQVAETAEFTDAEDMRASDRVSMTRLPFLVQLAAVPDGEAGESGRASLRQQFDIMPLARVIPRGEGYVVDPDFVPPALSLRAVPNLFVRIAALADRMLGKILDLEPEAGSKRLQGDVGVPQNLALLILLRSLHDHASAMQQAFEMPEIHPADVYYRLRQTVADLAAFSSSVSVRGEVSESAISPARPALAPYAHDDLGWRIRQAIDTIDLLLDGFGLGAQLSVELHHNPPDLWAAEIRPDFFEGPILRYFIRVESTMSAREIEFRLKDRKIGSNRDMRELIDRSLYGPEIHLLADPPRGLPSRAGRYTYFEIDTNDRYWRSIRQDRNIAIFCPELSGQEVRIRLYREASTA